MEANILKLISATEKIIIEALAGEVLISEANKTFMAIDPDFHEWRELKDTGDATGETMLDVYEMITNATYVQMFSELNYDFDKLVMTQEQIINFCEKYPDLLRQKKCQITFFLIKANYQYEIVYVMDRSIGLQVSVGRLGDAHLWQAHDRNLVIIPRPKS